MDASVICFKIARMNRLPPRKALLLAPLLLALAACQPKAPAAAPAPPAVAAPGPGTVMDISKPITARGTEPFWALIIDGKAMKLTRPDYPDIHAEAPGAAIAGGRATWVATTPEGQQITVSLFASGCSDGMSDLKYPMTAEVVMLNESLRGCAAKTAELPREGQPQ